MSVDILFTFSSRSAEGSPKIKQSSNIFVELANIFNEISLLAFTLRSPSWPHFSSSFWLETFSSSFLPSYIKQRRGRSTNFHKFIVYYTLLKLLCWFIVSSPFYDNSKRIRKVRCFVYLRKKRFKDFFLQSLRCYVSFSSSPFRASFIIVLARRHHLCVFFCLDVNYYDYEGMVYVKARNSCTNKWETLLF